MILSILTSLCLISAAASDAARRIIPDWAALGLAGCGLARIALTGDGWVGASDMAAAVAVFAVGAALFAFNWMGGGDVKLAAGATLALGAAKTPPFLLMMSVAGLALALGLFALTFLRRFSSGAGDALTEAREAPLPYGVAISTGALAALWAG